MTVHVNQFLTDQSQLSAQRSYDIAIQHRQNLIDVSHVFLALLDYPDDTLLQILNSLDTNIDQLKADTLQIIKSQKKVPFWRGKKYKMFITLLVKQSIDDAIALSTKLKAEKASSAHIFWSVINLCFQDSQDRYDVPLKMRQIFNNCSISSEKILTMITQINLDSHDQEKN
jgi:ATP-dependent Clp protease ATP-binding subunit ClpA